MTTEKREEVEENDLFNSMRKMKKLEADREVKTMTFEEAIIAMENLFKSELDWAKELDDELIEYGLPPHWVEDTKEKYKRYFE